MDEISTVLGAGASASALLKDLMAYAKGRKDPEVIEKVTQLQLRQMEMLEVQDQLREENRRLRDENQELKARAATRADLEWKDNVYWRREGDDLVGPYCPKCLDGDAKLVRMTVGSDYFRCTVCTCAEATPERNEDLQRAREKRRGPRERSWLDARR